MPDWRNKCSKFAFLLLILFLPIISSSYCEIFKFDDKFNNNRISSDLCTNQASNFTITSSLHRFVWIEGSLSLFISSNESGLINCEFIDSNNGRFFTQVNRDVNLTGFNQTQVIILNFQPHITTLPGIYNFTLTISGFYNYTENFELVLGMGYIILIFILLIFGISLIFILVKIKDSKIIKPVSISPEPSITSESFEVPSRKIQCPECKRLIDEGLTFCPECGSRIPEFLRFNPNSPRIL